MIHDTFIIDYCIYLWLNNIGVINFSNDFHIKNKILNTNLISYEIGNKENE